MGYETAITLSMGMMAFLFAYISFQLKTEEGKDSGMDDSGHPDTVGFDAKKIWIPIRLLFLMGSIIMTVPMMAINYKYIDAAGLTPANVTSMTKHIDAVYTWLPSVVGFVIIFFAIMFLFSFFAYLIQLARRRR